VRDAARNKVHSTLDLKDGYHQIPLKEECRHYLAFEGPDGRQYQPTVLPFGITIAPVLFQQTMNELVAVHFAIKSFRQYLLGRKFTIRTDYKPLEELLKKDLTLEKPRWNTRMLDIAEFDFEVEHIEGKHNVVADALSRSVAAVTVSWDSLELAQNWDHEVQELLRTRRRYQSFRHRETQDGRW